MRIHACDVPRRGIRDAAFSDSSHTLTEKPTALFQGWRPPALVNPLMTLRQTHTVLSFPAYAEARIQVVCALAPPTKSNSKTSAWTRHALKSACAGKAPPVVVNAQAAANVEILDVKALTADLLYEADHDAGGVPEDVHLGDCGS